MGAKTGLTRCVRIGLAILGLGAALPVAAVPHSLGICDEDGGIFLDGMRLPGLTGASVSEDERPLLRHLAEQGIILPDEAELSESLLQRHFVVLNVGRYRVGVQQWAGNEAASITLVSDWYARPHEPLQLMMMEILLDGAAPGRADIWLGNMPLPRRRYTDRLDHNLMRPLQVQLELARPLWVRGMTPGYEPMLHPDGLMEIIDRSVLACATPPF
ncbi:MAG: hypothetical protein C0462_03325 [Alcanivorax sp.]|nr:hypothetical protein [Alcanivorax sp.]